MITCRPAATDELERVLEESETPFAKLGTVTHEAELLVLERDGRAVLQVPLDDLDAAYRTDWRSIG